MRVRFADGAERLCGTSGLWNVPLGYGNKAIAAAAAEVLENASYLGVFRGENRHAQRAAEDLVRVGGPDTYERVMFSTSGGAANDLVMKLARQYQLLVGQPRRRVVVALRGSYHGLTFGSFALTGEDLGQAVYGVDQRLVRHVDANSIEELDELVRRQGDLIAAVVVEPVLGTGAVPLESPFIDRLLMHRREHGFLIAADEVATGFGRTGPYFASHAWAEQPDLLVASKGMTNGTMAASAVLLATGVAEVLAARGAVVTHAETQAGTALSCAVITATIEEMDRLDILPRARTLSVLLDDRLAELVASHPHLSATTGAGAFRSLRVITHDGTDLPAADVGRLVDAVRAAGSVVHPGLHGIQLIPALVYSVTEVDELLESVLKGLDAFLADNRGAWS